MAIHTHFRGAAFRAETRRHAFVKTVVLATLLLLAFHGEAVAEDDSSCWQASLSTPLNWISAAVGYEGPRVSGGEGAIAVDSIESRLVLYDSRGRGTDLGTFGKDPFLPSSIRHIPGDGYVLKLAGNKFVLLDENLEYVRDLGPTRDQAAGRGITSLYDWTVTANRRLVGFGTVMAPDNEAGYRAGFLTASLDDLDNPTLVIPTGDDEGEFYLYNQPYFASSSSGHAWFIRFTENRAEMYEVSPSGDFRRMNNAVPKYYRRSPKIETPNRGPESAPLIYAEIERSTIVAGLFAINDGLYVLTRRPFQSQTLWKMFEVNLETGRPVGQSFVLPTRPPHLTIVPAGGTIFTFEKGQVVGLGSHPINTLDTFKIDWLTSREQSPILLKHMNASLVRCKQLEPPQR